MPSTIGTTPTLRYHGMLQGEVSVRLLDMLEAMARSDDRLRPRFRKIAGALLELLDNAQRHGVRDNVDVCMHVLDDRFICSITNNALNIDALRLKRKADRIGRMAPTELRAAYVHRLANGRLGRNGGAGLGILRMARQLGSCPTIEVEPAGPLEHRCTSTIRCILVDPSKASGPTALVGTSL